MQTQPESFFNREDEILETDNQIGEEIQKLSREDRRSLFQEIFAHMKANKKKEDNED
jgi:hypothetical protein